MVYTKFLKILMVLTIAMIAFGGFAEGAFATTGTTGTTGATGTGAMPAGPFGNEVAPNAAAQQQMVNNNAGFKAVYGTILTYGKVLGMLIFAFATVVIVFAGFKYASSQGDTKVMEQAKMQIIAAGIGIGVVLIASALVAMFGYIFGIS